jgi:hypothetical protein
MKCVFRIVFSDGYFWISATGDYLSAIEYHSGYFSRGSHPSVVVREAFERAGDYEFEVLGELPESASRRLLDVAKQTFMDGDPMCINKKKGVVAQNEYNSDEYRRRKREEYRSRVRAQGKKVRTYTRRGI